MKCKFLFVSIFVLANAANIFANYGNDKNGTTRGKEASIMRSMSYSLPVSDTQATVYDSTGQIVYYCVDANDLSYYTSDLAPGQYRIVYTSADGTTLKEEPYFVGE